MHQCQYIHNTSCTQYWESRASDAFQAHDSEWHSFTLPHQSSFDLNSRKRPGDRSILYMFPEGPEFSPDFRNLHYAPVNDCTACVVYAILQSLRQSTFILFAVDSAGRTGNGTIRPSIICPAYNPSNSSITTFIPFGNPASLSDFPIELLGSPINRRKASHASDYAVAINWKAQKRLCNRRKTMLLNGKNNKPINVAIARELLGFLWDTACYEMKRINPKAA